MLLALAVALAGCGGKTPPGDGGADGFNGGVVLDPAELVEKGGGQGVGDVAGPDGNAVAGSEEIVELLEKVRDLPEERQVEVFESVVLLLDPDTYPLALELALSEQVGDEARGVLMADLFAHEDAGLRLPALVRVAESAADEVLRTAAVNHLVAAIGDDYGSNWASWLDAVEQHLEGGAGQR